MAGFIRTSQRFQRCEEQRLAAEEVGKIQPGQHKCNRQESEPAGHDDLQRERDMRQKIHNEGHGLDLANQEGIEQEKDHDAEM